MQFRAANRQSLVGFCRGSRTPGGDYDGLEQEPNLERTRGRAVPLRQPDWIHNFAEITNRQDGAVVLDDTALCDTLTL
ncbi:MAG: hypothetical protein BMS9Abin37_1963 [Acidobacteriota bacterium]|nr:MAG: hypothetical protein BMS9Abin37_1963 [Acidobacteriota bacterium]